MIKLATPVSHLFENKDYEKIIVKNSDVLECRDRSINYDNHINKQELFHCELQPIHEWGGKEWDFLQKIKDTKPSLKLLTLHMASCCDKPELSGRMFELGGREYTREEMKLSKQTLREFMKEYKSLMGDDKDEVEDETEEDHSDVEDDDSEEETTEPIFEQNNMTTIEKEDDGDQSTYMNHLRR